MRPTTIVAALSAAAIASMLAPVHAGPVFDDLLNYPIIDQRCPANASNEGVSLAGHQGATWLVLSKENPLGQTITLGPRATRLWRICAAPCWYPDNWQAGEAVTFTLYDSPGKSQKLYSRTLDFEHKWFKWDVPFDCRVPAKPGQSFYFELTHNGGGDNAINVVTIPGNEYKRGEIYVAGVPKPETDLYFVAITKPMGDRAANLKRFITSFNLDDPKLTSVRKAYSKGDLDAACKAVLREFESRVRDNPLVPKPIARDKLNTTGMDLVCDKGRYHKSGKPDGVWIEMSPETTWRETWPDSPSYVRQNDLFRELGEAYQTTRNEKYARKLNELMLDYTQDNASPYEGGMRGGRWVAMFVGWRMGDAWDGFGAAMKSKGLTDDVKLGWIDYWRRMGRFVEREPSSANQENASAECLMQFGLRFPEFAESRKWRQQGYDRLMANSLDLFRADGGSKEPTMNYQGYALGFLISGYETAKKHGLKLPAGIRPRLEKIHEFISYILMPNGQAPSNGDTNCQEFRPNATLHEGWRPSQVMRGADWFKREDLRFIGTAGKQGIKPKTVSTAFPDTRYFVMRSDWGGAGGKDFDQARYLLFRAGYDGGHSHYDYNQITLYAYGRPLILDPGRSDYGTPVQSELGKNRSHNVLLVDDLPMNNPEPTLHSWHTTPVMDFIDNEYKEIYPGVSHRRAVIFVRPDYYVVFDHAQSDKPHRCGINFWLTPPDLTIDKAGLAVHTNEPDGSNILIKCADPSGVQLADRKGSLKLDKDIRNDIPVVTFWKSDAVVSDFATVLYPYPKGGSLPKLYAKSYAAGEGRACVVGGPNAVDVLYCSPEPGPGLADRYGIDARAAVIRMTGCGLGSFAMIDGKRLSEAGHVFAECDKRISELAVIYTKDTVEVTCPKPDSSLQIACLGRKKAIVNGVERTIDVEVLKPFPSP